MSADEKIAARDVAQAEARLMRVARKLDAVMAEAKNAPADKWPTFGRLRAIDKDIAALALGAECLRQRRGDGRMTVADMAGAILSGAAGLLSRPEALNVYVGDELQHVLTFVLAAFDALPMFAPGHGLGGVQ